MNIQWKNLTTAIAIPLAVGGLSALLTQDGIRTFDQVVQPALTPPDWVFPIVWTILFVLMGIASYLVATTDPQPEALLLYAVQLVFNLLWSVWFLILATTIAFYRISKPAGYLMLPYLLWVTFAGYLNLCVWLLNAS